MSNPTTHVVVSGDTLYSLGKKYGLAVNDLKIFNNLTSNVIKTGQILELTKIAHKVVSGDTLFSLSKKYGTTVIILKSINGLKSDVIKVDQILKLKDIVELYWSYGDEQIRLEDVSRFYTDLNLHIITKGYKTGDGIHAVIEYNSDEGVQQFIVLGVVDNDGIAIIKNVFNGKTILV